MSLCCPIKTLSGADSVNLKAHFLVILLVIAFFAPPASAQQFDERQSFPQVSTMSPHGVDLNTGRFVKEGTELSIGPLVVDHYIKSIGEGLGPLGGQRPPSRFATSLHGRTWQHSTGGIGQVPTNARFVQVGKQQIKFSILSSGAFFPLDSSNVGWKMVNSGSQHVLTYKSGTVYRFAGHSSLPASETLLISTEHPDGHTITNSYDSSGRLKLVKSNRGYAVVLDYSGYNVAACGYNLTLTQVSTNSTCAASDLKITYGRDSSGKITSITNVAGEVVNLQYTGRYISCVTLPNSSTCAIQNVHWTPPAGQVLVDLTKRFDHVVQQTTANGEVWNYEHIATEDSGGDYTPYPGEILQTYSTMKPPIGRSTDAVFGNGFVQSIVGPEGRTSYTYSTQGAYQITYRDHYTIHYYSIYPSKITYSEGNSIQFTRDWADNVTLRIERAKPGSGLANNTIGWIYPTSYQWASPSICAAADVLCDKPTRVIDPKGNETDYTYSATHGGMLTETKPAVNGVRPQIRRTYVQRNAMIKSGSSYVAMQPAIWVLASEEYCKTSAAAGSGCAGGTADEVVTTYDYGPTSGPNNLLQRGMVADSGGLNLRTCYTYDKYGRKIAETQPEGTGSTCP
ncbi:hypothetical protein GCM10009096_15740 [Parasphingorhabdus litoris]|uniref:YD repeat-containing protein n=1 Tax=Parasphingorhabdus litoris TaxID=394733 RepID=A0ABN1AF62_9SPHN